MYIGQQTEPIHLLPSSKLKAISMNQWTHGLAAVDPESFYLEFYIFQTDSMKEKVGKLAYKTVYTGKIHYSLENEGQQFSSSKMKCFGTVLSKLHAAVILTDGAFQGAGYAPCICTQLWIS